MDRLPSSTILALEGSCSEAAQRSIAPAGGSGSILWGRSGGFWLWRTDATPASLVSMICKSGSELVLIGRWSNSHTLFGLTSSAMIGACLVHMVVTIPVLWQVFECHAHPAESSLAS
jgi:hypothetical protein